MPAVFCSGASTHHSQVALAVSFAAGGRLQDEKPQEAPTDDKGQPSLL
jgi:hypothetical protein